MFLYTDFLSGFEKAVLQAKRNIEEVELIAVSKRKTTTEIQPIINAKQISFGENQLQEIQQKWPLLKKNNANIKLHFVGGIQSKKLHEIIQHCDAIHTIDRLKLVELIAKVDVSKIQKKEFFIQVNTGNEPQKFGVALNNAEDLIQSFKDLKIKVSGLMCLPPENEDPSKHFQILQSLARNNHIKNLSMGMTNDFHIALKYGSTHIRIGSAIFGKRI